MTTEEAVFRRIDSQRKKKGVSQKLFCEMLGIKQQAYTNWKGGDNTSYMKKLPEIATILNVPLDLLVHGSVDPLTELSEDIREIVNIMETLDRQAIHQLMTYAYQLQQESIEREKTSTGDTSSAEAG